MSPRVCFAATLGGCSGRVQNHHLIPQQLLRREFPCGALLVDGYGVGRILRAEEGGWETVEFPDGLDVAAPGWVSVARRSLNAILKDPRDQVDTCDHHHQRVEGCRIAVPMSCWPAGLKAFASELGLTWFLERLEPSGERLAS